MVDDESNLFKKRINNIDRLHSYQIFPKVTNAVRTRKMKQYLKLLKRNNPIITTYYFDTPVSAPLVLPNHVDKPYTLSTPDVLPELHMILENASQMAITNDSITCLDDKTYPNTIIQIEFKDTNDVSH